MTPLRKPRGCFSVQLPVEVQAVVPPDALRESWERVPEISLASEKNQETKAVYATSCSPTRGEM